MIQRTVGSPKKSGQERRQGDKRHAQQQGEPREPGDLFGGQVAPLHDDRAQPELVDEVNEPQIHHRHAHQAVVGGCEQARDDERGRPAEQLGRPAHGSRPRDAADQRAIELAPTVRRGGRGARRRRRDGGWKGVRLYEAAHASVGSSVVCGGAPVSASIAVNNRFACSRRL